VTPSEPSCLFNETARNSLDTRARLSPTIRITADIYARVSPETNRQAADAMTKAFR